MFHCMFDKENEIIKGSLTSCAEFIFSDRATQYGEITTAAMHRLSIVLTVP